MRLRLVFPSLKRRGAPTQRAPRCLATPTAVGFDRSLNKAIVKLRHALGDEADSPETLPQHGYVVRNAMHPSSHRTSSVKAR